MNIRSFTLDVWRECYKTARDYSFYSRKHNSYTIIDYIMQKCRKAIHVEEIAIAPSIYSDHGPIIIEWRLVEEIMGINILRLDNFLLMNKDAVERVQREISIFFQANGKTVDKILLWDIFKAFIQDLLISQKVYMKRKKQNKLKNGLRELGQLEEEHKWVPMQEVKQRLDLEVAKLKLVEATQVANYIMYIKHKTFEYRDKPNAHLARISLGVRRKYFLPECMTAMDGREVRSIKDKLKTFADYCQEQYTSSELDRFLNKVKIPNLMDDHSRV